ncbi:hypothetical protein [Citricoccus nitrophenolicus]|uniref:hypothetical protein n=1 Tax=Citricoccus nitrophenolicus TaxID=863575 RepID=UPI0031ECB8A5
MTPITSSLPRLRPAPVDAHEHGWRVESRHATSEGWVLYVRCGVCRTLRVDRQTSADLPPMAVSAEVRPLGR